MMLVFMFLFVCGAKAFYKGYKSFTQKVDLGISSFVAWNVVFAVLLIIDLIFTLFILWLGGVIIMWFLWCLAMTVGHFFLYSRGTEFKRLLNDKMIVQLRGANNGPVMLAYNPGMPQFA